MRGLPDRAGVREQAPAFFGEDENAAATVGRVGRNADQSSALERLQRCGKSSAIHGEKGRYRAHGRRGRPVQRHEQGELSVGEAEGAQDFIKAPSQCARRPLHVKAEAGVPDKDGGFVRKRFLA